MGKMVDKATFRSEIKPSLAKENKTIALCHGVFDLIHPGHIIHLQQAKQMADVLVVSITATKYVRKGPGRPYFNDEMRMKFIEALECVDYVMLSEGYTVEDIVKCVEPDIYVKGEEYARESEDITGKMTEERELVEKHGGKVCYTSGQTFSSTKLINTALSGLSEEVIRYMEDFKRQYSMEDIKKYTELAKELKVLVIGDVIIDKYSYCIVQGLMSKDMGYSARLQYSEEYLGGAVAIARHLSSFTEQVTLMSIVGNEESVKLKLADELANKMQLQICYSTTFPTIVKHRYLEKNSKRDEYRKIFAVNNISDIVGYEEEIKRDLLKCLVEKIDEYDAVFLCDFGHGLINQEIMDSVQDKARYLVLNCQTNSTNQGMNIITKYRRADVFTCDQKELKLAFPMYASEEQLALKKVSAHLKGNGWLTRGARGAYSVDDGKVCECPAFTLSVKDTVGAGDAFFSVAGLYAAAGAPMEMGNFVGNIGGALGANIVGNKDSVEKVNVLKYASTLMNV